MSQANAIEQETPLAKAASWLQSISFVLLLVFPALARGGNARWAFLISFWLGAMAFSAMVIKRLLNHKPAVPRSGLELPLGLLLLLAIVSFFYSIYGAATIWAILRLLLYIGVFYIAVEQSAYRRGLTRMAIVVLSVAVFEVAFGLIKHSGFPVPFFWAFTPGTQKTYFLGTFINHNHFAGYLEIALCLAVGLAVRWARENRFPLYLAIGLVILIGLVFSLSRGGWVGGAVGAGFTLAASIRYQPEVRLKRPKLMLAGLVAVLIVLFMGSPRLMDRLQSLSGQADSSQQVRMHVWKSSLALIKERPLTGTGLGTFPWAWAKVRAEGVWYRHLVSYNDYLQVVAEMGLLAFIPIIMGLWMLAKAGIGYIRTAKSRFRISMVVGALGGIVAIMVHGVVDYNIQITSNGILFSVLAGLVMGSYRAHMVNLAGQDALARSATSEMTQG